MLYYLLFIFPLGPAESLFKESYYELMKRALKPDGLLCCQGKCLTFVGTKNMFAAIDHEEVSTWCKKVC